MCRLKLCPFCPNGGDPELTQGEYASNDHAVCCQECGTFVDPDQWCVVHNDEGMSSEEIAIAAWNTRLGENFVLQKALVKLYQAFLNRHGCFPIDKVTDDQKLWNEAMSEASNLIKTQKDKPQ